MQLHNQVHVTLYRRLIVCHSVLVNPENFICSCLVKVLVLFSVCMTLCDVYTKKYESRYVSALDNHQIMRTILFTLISRYL